MAKKKGNNRTFNTGGLCFPEKHYMVNPLQRLEIVESLIKEELYFTIHAPRQTGKTTYLHALARKLNAEGTYIALLVSFERAGYRGVSVEKANSLLIDSVFNASNRQLPAPHRPENPRDKNYLDLQNYLEKWATAQSKPVVLLVDEIDALLDDVLISILRQLRDGYQHRPNYFPASVVLVGLRDVREYKTVIRENPASMGTASPFNVKSESLFLADFTREEVFHLLEQHTGDTGQAFPTEVKEEIFNLSKGQPWLTNAIARQIIFWILKYDFSQKITPELVGEAKRQLILRRDTHLDSLVDKLKEDRVKRICQAIINGANLSFDILNDDIAYVRDLGIVGPMDPLAFANPIYGEIIPRLMAAPIESSLPGEIQPPFFIDEKGKLDMDKVLREFQAFYRRNSGSWLERYEYKESAQHLLLMSFLQRIVNSGGEIIREMAVGNGRIDLLVQFKKQEFALELKIKWNNLTIEDGKDQLVRYLDRLGLAHGYLVIFDPSDLEWDEKIHWKKISHKNKTITMVGI